MDYLLLSSSVVLLVVSILGLPIWGLGLSFMVFMLAVFLFVWYGLRVNMIERGGEHIEWQSNAPKDTTP